MKTIIFIGTNKSGSSREAIRAAERMGYFTVVFTNNEKQLSQRNEYTDVHEMIFVDINNFSDMKNEINRLKSTGKEIKTIVSFVDSNVCQASTLCEEFCHNRTSSNCIKIMEDKEQTRTFLKNQPYTPKFLVITPDEQLSIESINVQLQFPVMVKSPTSTGSKDVLLATGTEQLEKHVASLRNKSPDKSIILEEYIVGDQYLVEALIFNKNVQIAGIIKQEITQGKRFIITGYGVYAEVPSKIEIELKNILNSIISQFGIENGAMHLELRLSTNGWKLIEINPRISGGAMNTMLQAAFGFNLVEETLKLYLGGTPSLQPTCRNYVYTHYLVVSKKGVLEKVTGKQRAKNSPGVVEVYVKPKKGTKLIPPLSMGHRYAYVIAQGASMNEAKMLAENAANEIKFHLKKTEIHVNR